MNRDDLTRFFNSLDRSFFIDNEYRGWADINKPLPIGFGQTISQPSLVVEMTYELQLEKDCKVLEIGTGSGYQTAFLAEYAGAVYTVEIIPELSKKAGIRLEALGYKNVYYKIGDGSEGWSEFAPFERIIVTAASEKVPAELIDQLKGGGKMIAPVGPQGYQDLLMIDKDEKGLVKTESIGKVVFVELKGKYGFRN